MRCRILSIVIIPLIFIGFGLIRELAVGEIFLRSEGVSVLGLLYLFSFYGGVGFAIAVFAQEANRVALGEKENRIKTLEKELAARDSKHELGLRASGVASDVKGFLGVLEKTSNVIGELEKANNSITNALGLQSKCLRHANELLTCLVEEADERPAKKECLRPVNEILDDALELAELLIEDTEVSIERNYDELKPVGLEDISVMQSVINLVKNLAESSKPGAKIAVSAELKGGGVLPVLVIGVRDFRTRSSREALDSREIDSPDEQDVEMMKVLRLVEESGGEVEVKSDELDEGTEVLVRYPVIH